MDWNRTGFSTTVAATVIVNTSGDGNTWNSTANATAGLTTEEELRTALGNRYNDTLSTICLLTIYGLIFISGTVGNICTCVVIIRNNYMRTTTNCYLFSLAISDVLILLLALPPEAYSILEAYPWRFGKAFCYIKGYLQEMTSYASVLTITAFTVERYVAICHPLKAHKFANISRSIKIIIAIWVVSLAFALPYPVHTELFYFIDRSKNNGTPLEESLVCNIPQEYYTRMTYIFQLSTFLFFVFPLTVIIVLYFFIALALRQAALQRVASQESSAKLGQGPPVTQSGKAVFRMLVAVVVAFFVCWAPFHAQRLLTIYNRVWTPLLLHIQATLFYISGVLYFVGSTVNPILYNVMSKRYREAFKDTICRCRKKRAKINYGSSFHQSYYFNKSGRTPSRPRTVGQEFSLDDQTSRIQDHRANALSNGNAPTTCNIMDPMKEQLLSRTTNEDAHWSGAASEKLDCKACVSDMKRTVITPSLERQVLLQHASSADSSC